MTILLCRYRHVFTGFFFCLLSWFSLISHANSVDIPQKRVALVIGNSQYENEKYYLPNAVNDAKAIQEVLRRLGFEVTFIEDVRKTHMAKILIDFSKKMDHAENGIFFYAGHAFEVNHHNYLVPVDARAIPVKDQAELQLHLKSDFIDFNDILEVLKKNQTVKNRANLIFLDACRDNPWREALQNKKRAIMTETHFAPIVAAPGNHIYYSTQSGTQAYDASNRDNQHSPYTEALLEYMQKYRYIDVQILQKYLKKHVKELTQHEEEGAQIPQYVSLNVPADLEQKKTAKWGIITGGLIGSSGLFVLVLYWRKHQKSVQQTNQEAHLAETDSPQEAETLLNQAKHHYQNQDYASAIAQYNAILTKYPTLTLAYYGRAKAYDHLGKYALAQTDYTHALRAHPQEANFYYRRGSCAMKLKQLQQAQSDYEAAIRCDQRYFAAYAALGALYYGQNQYEQALEQYNWAIALNPRSARYYQMRAHIKTKLGDLSGAEKDQHIAKEITI